MASARTVQVVRIDAGIVDGARADTSSPAAWIGRAGCRAAVTGFRPDGGAGGSGEWGAGGLGDLEERGPLRGATRRRPGIGSRRQDFASAVL
ncbi:hypothetical protein D7S86_06410 [Pararobbsia silviterrae]|uniref:Uncharacterized protein n=1 Tax=Pararobbsia silviterrae TaxID=1792498 RepID=A0A494Y4I8_9BURK|nr:hypothetical protein D7S86_06410 [Pararobbsia silviterrae]